MRSYLISALAFGSAVCACYAAEVRFRPEHVRKPLAEPAKREYGLIDRVRYRVAAGAGLAIEREPVLTQDPQKGTLARPVPEPGGTWFREMVAPALSGGHALGWGDFDGDGSDELLAGWPAAIWKRSPDGHWSRLAEIRRMKRGDDVAVGDWNNDGLADVAVSGTVYWNETKLAWVRHVIVRGYRTQTVVAGDFTGRGGLDVITGDIENDRRISLYSGPEWTATLLKQGIRVIQSLALDIDGDGDLDYIGAQYHPGLIFWLERPKDPLHDQWTYHVIDDAKLGGVDGVHGLALADLDGDGKPELIATSDWPEGKVPNSIAWFRIPPDPRVAQRWERFVLADRDAPGFNHYLGVGDVNEDGLLDVATGAKAGPDGNWFAWWQHPRDVTRPWQKHLIAANQPGATNILIHDLNGDGKPDFLASRGHGRGVVWFEAPQWIPHEVDTTLIGPHALAIGDLDGDGDSDFAVCAKDSGILAWFENDGKGNFTAHRIFTDQSAYEIKLVEMNGDGAPDILVAGQESQNVVWYENRLRKTGARRNPGRATQPH